MTCQVFWRFFTSRFEIFNYTFFESLIRLASVYTHENMTLPLFGVSLLLESLNRLVCAPFWLPIDIFLTSLFNLSGCVAECCIGYPLGDLRHYEG
jgi:hypothetical protein